MSKKPKQKNKTSKAIVADQPVRRLAWGNAMPKQGGNTELAVIDFCNKVALVYGVPSMGVNVMGSQPYLNKDGRLFLLNDLRKGKNGVKAIRKEVLQFSKSIDEPSVVKTTIVFMNGVEVEAIGEASKQSVKLEAVKQTLNMMAETRSLNRAIWSAIAGDVWNRVAENLAKLKGVSELDKAKITRAGEVSYEEIQRPSEEFVKTTPEEELIQQLKEKVDAVTDVFVLIDYAEKLEKGKAPKRVKDVLREYIKQRQDNLTK